jgi:putative transposase
MAQAFRWLSGERGQAPEAVEAENARLKKLVAERDLEIEVMKEVVAKNW